MEYEIKASNTFSLNIKEFWAFRELIYFFTLRDIKIKYKQTVLGALWAVLQPFLLMIVFTIFFAPKFTVPGLPYPVFVFSGLILWNVFSSGIINAGNSMVNNSNIIKKIYFPRLIIPVSSVLGTLLDFAMTLIMFAGIILYYHPVVSISQLAFTLPLALLIILLTTFGLGFLLAGLNVKYRDFRYVIPFMVQILLFLTPVIYPVSIIEKPWVQKFFLLNPVAGGIEILRSSFNHGTLSPELVLRTLIISLFLFITGIIFFRRTEYYFADLA